MEKKLKTSDYIIIAFAMLVGACYLAAKIAWMYITFKF